MLPGRSGKVLNIGSILTVYRKNVIEQIYIYLRHFKALITIYASRVASVRKNYISLLAGVPEGIGNAGLRLFHVKELVGVLVGHAS